MKEQWRDVVGYSGYYEVSNLGRVRSVDRVVRHHRGGPLKLKGQILRPGRMDKVGHLGVCLSKDGIARPSYVHQLVAITWIGSCPSGQQIRHGSNGILDNSVANLCYGTQSENQLDKRRDGTGGRPVRRSDGVKFNSMIMAAEETGCDAGNIWRVCNNIYKTTGGFGWEYI